MNLTTSQLEIVEQSFGFKEQSQPKAIYPFWFQSIIIETIGGKYYKVDTKGNISNSSYHDIIGADQIWFKGEPVL